MLPALVLSKAWGPEFSIPLRPPDAEFGLTSLHLAELALRFLFRGDPAFRHLGRLIEEEELHLLAQKLAGFRLDRIQSVVIDQNGHLRLPQLERLGRDVFVDALSQLAREGRLLETGKLFPQLGAQDRSQSVP